MWLWTFGCAISVEQVLAREPDLERGALVYAARCAECHGEDGTGGEGTNLTNDDNTPEQIADRVLFGWGEMEPMFGELTVRDAADVVAYVAEVIQQP